MIILLNILGLIFEILFYSLFMKFTRKEGNFFKYLFAFTTITVIGLIIGTQSLISCLLLIAMILLGIKYIVKIKTTFYDLFFIFLMMLFKLILEAIIVFFISIIIKDPYVMAITLGIVKILFILLFREYLNKIYEYIKIFWYQNKFFIRYIFDILMFAYVILSCVFLILNR